MNIGILYGTFDTLHYGHIEAIKYCLNHCDKLIVALSTDEFNRKKKKKALYSYWQRYEIINSIKGVSEVIPEYCWEQKVSDCIKHEALNVFVSEDFFDETEKVLGDMVGIKCIPRTPQISSTEIRGKMK